MFVANRQTRGQGLLESIIGIGVILAGTIGAITLVSSTIRAGRTSNNQIVAASLAREGIEVVRTQRDSNWLKIQANEDTDSGTSGIQLDTFSGIFDPVGGRHLVVPQLSSVGAWQLRFLQVGGDFSIDCGFPGRPCSNVCWLATPAMYRQRDACPSGNDQLTVFRRLLEIDPVCREDDSPADGVPDVGSAAAERIVGLPNSSGSGAVDGDGQACAANEIMVGVRVLSRVQWSEAGGTKRVELEDRLYNWKYAQ